MIFAFCLEFPPQARGWTVDSVAPPERRVVSPAGAGMDHQKPILATHSKCFPRRRGDGPAAGTTCWPWRWFPPQARGWTIVRHGSQKRGAVSPAGAGMDPSSYSAQSQQMGFPRRRGDGPQSQKAVSLPKRFPPQARGWTQVGVQGLRHGVVSPAGAGMDPPVPGTVNPSMRFPRRRGDGPLARTQLAAQGEFPPQARGWTIAWNNPLIRCLCFPRRRGDGPLVPVDWARHAAFPPQARGWTPRMVLNRPPSSVSPAGAGMDPQYLTITDDPQSFPRRRGDGPQRGRGTWSRWGFPPQARGWTFSAPVWFEHPEVSPAGAGMDPASVSVVRYLVSFPRRRGDGPEHFRILGLIDEFPPQARGWTPALADTSLPGQVSPAGAGMDLSR